MSKISIPILPINDYLSNMNIRLTTLLLGAFLIYFSFLAKGQSIVELRKQYMIGLHDLDSTPKVYQIFKSVKEPSGKVLGYTGALQAIMTKTTWNLFKKMSFLRQSEVSFNSAVGKAPKDIEIRFMRMAVQFEIPEYLGFSEDMETDRKFIIENIDNFDTSGIPSGTLDEIFHFMKRCEKFTDEQIEKFKGILASN